MLLPLLSEYDPAVKTEGSLDPLGMYAIADAMGVKLIPGVRERQRFPRFLTAIAVSFYLCQEFGDDQIASDGISEPWQVFEWHVVEGLVRKFKEEEQIRGLPGRDKAKKALDEGFHLCADKYLKTPTVFGFHGVYRVLAREIGVEANGRLGEFGYELIKCWADEQRLPGFVGTQPGIGAKWKADLKHAINDGLAYGSVQRQAGWRGWEFIENHLAPHKMGKLESKLLHKGLLETKQGFRGEVLRSLGSKEGQTEFRRNASEKKFHQLLMVDASRGLRDLLIAIAGYELFARLLQDAFDDCRSVMTLSKKKVKPDELAETEGVKKAAGQIPKVFDEVQSKLDLLGLGFRFQEQFDFLSNAVNPKDWAVILMDHHTLIQKRKPPAGKAPWIEKFDDGNYMIRTQYRYEPEERRGNKYVHRYRTFPLWSFAIELGLVKK